MALEWALGLKRDKFVVKANFHIIMVENFFLLLPVDGFSGAFVIWRALIVAVGYK